MYKNAGVWEKITLPVVVEVLYYGYYDRWSKVRGDTMISSDVMRGFNDLLILSLLQQEDSYGYHIANSIKQISGGAYVMKETTLYSAFARLEKNKLIRSYASDETFGKPRTYYTITPLGRAIYQDKVAEWQDTKDLIDRFVASNTTI